MSTASACVVVAVTCEAVTACELSIIMAKRNKVSVIWELCTEDPEDESQVKCNLCGIIKKKRWHQYIK